MNEIFLQYRHDLLAMQFRNVNDGLPRAEEPSYLAPENRNTCC